MRWLTFVIAAFFAVAIEKGLLDVVTLQSLGGLRPTLVPVLVVFISLLAPKHTSLVAAWILGMLVDLGFPVQHAGGMPLYIIGPHALGYVLASFAVLQVRPMVFRQRVLTLAILSLAAVLLAGIVVTAILSLRATYPVTDAPAPHTVGSHRLFMTMGSAVYTALLAVPVGILLGWSLPLWGFYHAGPRSTNVR